MENSFIVELVNLIVKTRKLLRMYPENNPMYIKALDDMYAKFVDVFDKAGGDIKLDIRQYEIYYGDEKVYQNFEKTDNIALYFFKDGIRELTFKKGIPKEELKDFFHIIGLDEKELVEEDIVSLMWERDFQYIKYVVDESVLAEDEEYERVATKRVMENPTSQESILEAYNDAIQTEDIKTVQIVPITEHDLKMLLNELEKDSEPKTGKLADILFEILYNATQRNEFEELVSIINSLLDYSIQNLDIDNAINILKRIKTIIDDRGTPVEVKIILKKVMEHAGSPQVIKTLGNVIDSRIEIDEGKINEFVNYLEKNSIQPLIEILGELKNFNSRRIIINALSVIGRKDIHSLAKGLNDERWYVVRNVIYVLRLIGDRRAIEYLTKVLRHPDMRVRREAIRAMGEIRSPVVVPILKEFLNDFDPQIRITAVRAIANTKTESARRLILQQIQSGDFINRKFEEKKEYFEVLTFWKDEDIMNFLLKVLKKSTIFKRNKNFENRACAAYALGLMGMKDALPYLKKYADIKNPLMREYVRSSIMKLESIR